MCWSGRRTKADDVDEARDCTHLELRASGACCVLHACVNDRDARCIEPYFKSNPALADACIAHPNLEVRAIAVKHANVFLMPMLLEDAEETCTGRRRAAYPSALWCDCTASRIGK